MDHFTIFQDFYRVIAEMTEEEIIKVIDEVFNELNPTSMKEMGMVMKELNAKITNADMSLVSKMVKERLS